MGQEQDEEHYGCIENSRKRNAKSTAIAIDPSLFFNKPITHYAHRPLTGADTRSAVVWRSSLTSPSSPSYQHRTLYIHGCSYCTD